MRAISLSGLCLFTVLLLPLPSAAAPVQLRFQTADSANLVWMIDQMSRWDEKKTSPAYFFYWKEKIGLDETDLDMLDKYARIRQRMESQAPKKKGYGLNIFGSPEIGPGDKYFLSFLEIPRPDVAISTLPLSDMDKKTLFDVVKHFGKKMGTQGGWGQEIAHLRSFQQQASVLATLSDAAGYLTQVRDFLGVADTAEILTVDALWAPPGSRFVKPAIFGFHIILPLPVSSVKNDEEVIKQISVAMAESVRYLIGKLPEQVRSQATAMVINKVGFPNPTNPSLMLDSICVALGQVLYTMNRFPNMKQELIYTQFDPALRYPYATDLLSRALAPQIAAFMARPNSFLYFLEAAIRIQAGYFPPTSADFAAAGLIFGPDEAWFMFRSVFRGFAQQHFGTKDLGDLFKAHRTTGYPIFILATKAERDEVESFFRKFNIPREALAEFKRYEGAQGVIYPLMISPAAGPALLIIGLDIEVIKRGIIQLHRFTTLPVKPVVIN